jgi:hypothetical protein
MVETLLGSSTVRWWLVVGIAASALLPAGTSQSLPPNTPGVWVVDGEVKITDAHVVHQGDIVVLSGATLELERSVLTMDVLPGTQYSIRILEGGKLLLHGTQEKPSRIERGPLGSVGGVPGTGKYGEYWYHIHVKQGAVLEGDWCRLSGFGLNQYLDQAEIPEHAATDTARGPLSVEGFLTLNHCSLANSTWGIDGFHGTIQLSNVTTSDLGVTISQRGGSTTVRDSNVQGGLQVVDGGTMQVKNSNVKGCPVDTANSAIVASNVVFQQNITDLSEPSPRGSHLMLQNVTVSGPCYDAVLVWGSRLDAEDLTIAGTGSGIRLYEDAAVNAYGLSIHDTTGEGYYPSSRGLNGGVVFKDGRAEIREARFSRNKWGDITIHDGGHGEGLLEGISWSSRKFNPGLSSTFNFDERARVDLHFQDSSGAPLAGYLVGFQRGQETADGKTDQYGNLTVYLPLRQWSNSFTFWSEDRFGDWTVAAAGQVWTVNVRDTHVMETLALPQLAISAPPLTSKEASALSGIAAVVVLLAALIGRRTGR